MSRYTKSTEVMQYTETVWYEDGVEVQRDRNYDDHWYDTESTEDVSDEDWTDEFGD